MGPEELLESLMAGLSERPNITGFHWIKSPTKFSEAWVIIEDSVFIVLVQDAKIEVVE